MQFTIAYVLYSLRIGAVLAPSCGKQWPFMVTDSYQNEKSSVSMMLNLDSL